MADAGESTGPSKSALKKAEKQAKMAAEKAAKAAKQAALPVQTKKADNTIGITVSKSEDFPQWYQEVVLKAQMIDYYNEISGFYILRPAAMYVWNTIRRWFQERIELMGVEETSFPMFLSQASFEKEKDHVEGFAPELAWVTKACVFTYLFLPAPFLPNRCCSCSALELTGEIFFGIIVAIKNSRSPSRSVLHLRLSCTPITRNGLGHIGIFPSA